VFYVSPTSVYVWMTEWAQRGQESGPQSFAYRIPLDGSGPTVLRVAGGPVDQFSFLESGDGHLNVLVRADTAGEGMWGSEVAQGSVALLRVPLASFSAQGDPVPASRYTALPKPEGYTFQNRFVGDYVLYGAGSGWGRPENQGKGAVFAYRFAGGAEPVSLRLVHGVDRIEALGRHAVVIGTDGKDLHFTPIALTDRPAVADRYSRRGASQGELRSHGFFYKPESENAGLLGLPIRGAGSPGYVHLRMGSASILFLRNDSLRLTELGSLAAREGGSPNDGCRASCVDWYGNARPLFLRGRLFALLGYELVEGTISAGRMDERRRIDFSPAPARVAR
jgi:hypothetical protein